MKNTVKRLAALMLALLMLLCLTACVSRAKISLRLNAFEKALQEADVDAIADCINPNIVDPIRAVAGLFGGLDELTGASDYFSQLMESVGLDEILDDLGEVNWDTISVKSIKAAEYDFNEAKDRCAVTAEVTVDIAGSERTVNVTINMVEVEDEWYIGLFA